MVRKNRNDRNAAQTLITQTKDGTWQAVFTHLLNLGII